jgi:hypothetical protein
VRLLHFAAAQSFLPAKLKIVMPGMIIFMSVSMSDHKRSAVRSLAVACMAASQLAAVPLRTEEWGTFECWVMPATISPCRRGVPHPSAAYPKRVPVIRRIVGLEQAWLLVARAVPQN